MSTGVQRIERATTCVDDERSVLRTEREAFRDLREFLRSRQPVSATDGGALVTRTVTQGRGSTAEFIDTYRQTVMAVDHYESEYSEPIEENLAMELGPEITTAIRTNAELNPFLYRKLLIAIDESLRRRSRLLDVLTTEHNCLQTAIEECRTLDRQLAGVPDCHVGAVPFGELERNWDRLTELEDRCERLLRSRQRFIAERRSHPLDIADHVSFNEYLYGTLDSRFPVLETGLELFDRIDSHR